MCVTLFQEKKVTLSLNQGPFDATIVKEPGKTGRLWRIHYRISLPSLSRGYCKLIEVTLRSVKSNLNLSAKIQIYGRVEHNRAGRIQILNKE